MKRLIVAGSRDISDYQYVKNCIDEFVNEHGPVREIISGTAKGVDSFGEKYSLDNLIPLIMFPADWDGLGPKAGHIRNQEMADYADSLLLIWDGKSPGSKNMLKTAKREGLFIVQVINGEKYEVSGLWE